MVHIGEVGISNQIHQVILTDPRKLTLEISHIEDTKRKKVKVVHSRDRVHFFAVYQLASYRWMGLSIKTTSLHNAVRGLNYKSRQLELTRRVPPQRSQIKPLSFVQLSKDSPNGLKYNHILNFMVF